MTYEEALDKIVERYNFKDWNDFLINGGETFNNLTDEVFKVMRKAAILYGEGKEPKWISVKERLPESKADVLCLYDNGYKLNQCVGCYTKGHEIEYCDEDYQGEYDEVEDKNGTLYLKPGWYECEETPGGEYDEVWVRRNVTHWMPLPQPPQG